MQSVHHVFPIVAVVRIKFLKGACVYAVVARVDGGFMCANNLLCVPPSPKRMGLHVSIGKKKQDVSC